MNKLREKFDAMAWAQIHSRPVPTGVLADHYGLRRSGRPASFGELEELLRNGTDSTIARCMFLDEFYLFRRVEFFAIPPSDYFDDKMKAFFAAMVEYLCRRFGLPVPAWTEERTYFLQEYWRKSHDDTRDPAFVKRNVGYTRTTT